MIIYFDPDRADAWVEVSPTGEPLTERQVKEAVFAAPEDANLYTRSSIAVDAARLRLLKNPGMGLQIITGDRVILVDDDGHPSDWDWKEELTTEILGEMARVRRASRKSLVQERPPTP